MKVINVASLVLVLIIIIIIIITATTTKTEDPQEQLDTLTGSTISTDVIEVGTTASPAIVPNSVATNTTNIEALNQKVGLVFIR